MLSYTTPCKALLYRLFNREETELSSSLAEYKRPNQGTSALDPGGCEDWRRANEWIDSGIQGEVFCLRPFKFLKRFPSIKPTL